MDSHTRPGNSERSSPALFNNSSKGLILKYHVTWAKIFVTFNTDDVTYLKNHVTLI